jgi:hypothetical protein
MEHLRTLRRDYNWDYDKLKEQFGISHGAVKRILHSKFEPTDEIKKRQDERALALRNERRLQQHKDRVHKLNQKIIEKRTKNN